MLPNIKRSRKFKAPNCKIWPNIAKAFQLTLFKNKYMNIQRCCWPLL